MKRKSVAIRYNSVTPKDFPPGYSNIKVLRVRKAKGKSQLIVTITADKRINL